MAMENQAIDSNSSQIIFPELFLRIKDFFENRYQGSCTEIKLMLAITQNLQVVADNKIQAPLLRIRARDLKLVVGSIPAEKEGVDLEYHTAIQLFRALSPDEDVKALVVGNAASVIGSQHIVSFGGEGVPFEEEQKITNLLPRVLSNDAVLGLCFNNDRKSLENALIEKNISSEEFANFLAQAKYMHEFESSNKKGICEELQQQLIAMFMRSPRTVDEMASFEANLDLEVAEKYFGKDVQSQIKIAESQVEQAKTM